MICYEYLIKAVIMRIFNVFYRILRCFYINLVIKLTGIKGTIKNLVKPFRSRVTINFVSLKVTRYSVRAQ